MNRLGGVSEEGHVKRRQGRRADSSLPRTPPVAVRRQLRREVGFGCPVRDCGNPYLEWAHFDPPWHIRKHHNPDGMIALCHEHHIKADAGAFTIEQLRELKCSGVERAANVRGRFDWMRRRLLAVVGGNFYYEVRVILQMNGVPKIWFNRDDDGYLLLNVQMISDSAQSGLHIEDNYWITRGSPDDVVSPPSGKLLDVKYASGASFRIEFFELNDVSDSMRRYPRTSSANWGELSFPITAVEIHMNAGNSGLGFSPHYTHIPNAATIRGSFFHNGNVAVDIRDIPLAMHPNLQWYGDRRSLS